MVGHAPEEEITEGIYGGAYPVAKLKHEVIDQLDFHRLPELADMVRLMAGHPLTPKAADDVGGAWVKEWLKK